MSTQSILVNARLYEDECRNDIQSLFNVMSICKCVSQLINRIGERPKPLISTCAKIYSNTQREREREREKAL